MTSKMIHVAGMKTESELPYAPRFHWYYGILSTLQRDNAKSEMSQRFRQIH
jgi:hypothetical protein